MNGRKSVRIAGIIEKGIVAGDFPVGEYLPTIMSLCSTHSVSYDTIRRSLKILQSKGFVRSEPGHGYRVLVRANDPHYGAPLAVIVDSVSMDVGDSHQKMLSVIREFCKEREWPILVLDKACSADMLMKQLSASRAFGVIVEDPRSDIIKFLAGSKIPSIVIDGACPDWLIDSVMQDGQQGGIAAVEYAISKGCKRIAWFGVLNDDIHTIDRYSGFAVAMQRAGLVLQPQLHIEVDEVRELEQARELLSMKDRPDAVVALWHSFAEALKVAAAELGLVLGKDIEIIGWSPDENLKDMDLFLGKGYPQPFITWSITDMIEIALIRLDEQRLAMHTKILRIKIPTKLDILTAEG